METYRLEMKMGGKWRVVWENANVERTFAQKHAKELKDATGRDVRLYKLITVTEEIGF